MQALLHFVISIWVPLVCAVIIVAVLPLVAGYIVLVERKVLADFQVRLGPMRVGPHGLLQPIADALKLILKEDIIPTDADQRVNVNMNMNINFPPKPTFKTLSATTNCGDMSVVPKCFRF